MFSPPRWFRACAALCALILASHSLQAQDAILGFEPLRPRLTVRQDFGNGVGYDDGFTYAQGWIPFLSVAGDHTMFLDLRLTNYLDARLWEYNLGGGYRWYGATLNRIHGVNCYYDGRYTDANSFQQLGFGFESLGQYVDFRGNYYLPIGETAQLLSETVGNPRFSAFNILLDRTLLVQNAMRGFDVEAGTPIPMLDQIDPRVFLGYYHYEGTGAAPNIDGIRGRFEANYNDRVSLHAAVSHDNFFDTTVTGGLAFHIGGRQCKRERYCVPDRLDTRVVRDVNIVLTENKTVTTEKAIDPKTGQPIVVFHANSKAAAGGDGSVEMPFQSLTQLQAGSTPGSILFLHADSTFTQQTLALQAGQRLLGEGIDHIFEAQQGTFLLPRATAGTALPLLLRTGGGTNAINLGLDNEVSGLRYQRTGGAGGFIGATGNVGNFNINRNTTTGGLFAIGIANANGNGVVTGNTFSAHAINSIGVVQTAGSLRLLVDGNTFNSGTAGVVFTQTGGTHFLGIRNNTFTSTASVADTVVGGTHTLQLRNNVGTGGYVLTRVLGTFQAENTLGTNTPAPGTLGTITLVPVGTAGFPE